MATPTTADARSDVAVAPPLPVLLRLALEHNPRLVAARERAAAAADDAVVAGSLPDPRLTLGWYAESVETRLGPQRWSLSLMQTLPWPGRLADRAAAANADARRARVAHERAVRDVLTAVIDAAHELAWIDTALAVTADMEAVLDRWVAATADPGADALLSEHFRATTQRVQLTNDRVVLHDRRRVEEQRLRGLLDLPPAVAIGTPLLPEAPDLGVGLDELFARAEAHAHELREAGLALEAAEHRAAAARSNPLPDLHLGVTRIQTARLDRDLGVDPEGNGNDPLVFSVGIDLPLGVGRDRAERRAAAARRHAAAADRTAAIQDLRDRVARAWLRVSNATRLERLTADLLLPRANDAALAAEDRLAAGDGSVAGLLETLAVWHEFRLTLARARADRGQAVAALEAAIGAPFARVPADGAAPDHDDDGEVER